MKAVRTHKRTAKSVALRAQIKALWLARAQRYPFETVTVALIRRQLPTKVHYNTVLKHMDDIRRESAVNRALKTAHGNNQQPEPCDPRCASRSQTRQTATV